MIMEQPISFEFFPPATPKMEALLWRSVQALAPLRPRFVSVTYGADGSTRDRTHRIVQRIQQETGLICAPHLTCVGASRDEVLDLAETYWQDGIRQLVALRGDPPKESDGYTPRPDGFAYAVDLVTGLAGVGAFDISVAAYPEVHPEAPDADFDLANLKHKIEAGATRAITQFFFDVDAFLRFRDRCVSHGIDVPIVPGILPIANFTRMLNFAGACGTCVPDWLRERFAAHADDPGAQRDIATQTAIEQVMALRNHGVEAFHFYTLNRAELTLDICAALGITPVGETDVA